jgi:hypothetical protein
MKISNDTVSILKNFANINQGILIKPGKSIRTISNHKNILADAVVSEEFPVEVGIYDLNNFLSIISLYKDELNLEFKGNDIVISGKAGRSKISYRGCPSNMVTAPPEKGNPELSNPEITFELKQEDFDWILQTASVLSSPQIGVQSNGKKISLISFDSSDDSSHVNSLEIADGNGDSYKMIFKTENMKMIPDSYDVSISSKGFATFKSKSKPIQYWVTTEKGGEYKKK